MLYFAGIKHFCIFAADLSTIKIHYEYNNWQKMCDY